MTDRRHRAVIVALLVFSSASCRCVWAQDVKIQKLGRDRFMTESVVLVPAGERTVFRLEGPANLGGSANITVGAIDSVRIEMTKVFKAASETVAAEWDGLVEGEVDTAGGRVLFKVRTRRAAPWEGSEWSARADLVITVPENWDIEGATRFFEYDLTGPFRTVAIDNEYGRVRVENAAEKVRVGGSYTAIELVNVRGDVSARTSFGDLAVRNAISSADAPVRLVDNFGTITVQKLAGAVVAETENSPITLSDLVLVGSASSVRGANSPIEASIVEFGNAQLQVHTSNAPVVLRVPRSLSARLNLAVGTAGRIHTSDLRVQTHADLLSAGRLEGTCGSGQGVIDVDVSGPGSIEVEGK